MTKGANKVQFRLRSGKGFLVRQVYLPIIPSTGETFIPAKGPPLAILSVRKNTGLSARKNKGEYYIVLVSATDPMKKHKTEANLSAIGWKYQE